MTHQAGPHDGETTTERLARNWADILQELRSVQSGTQILTGFLLILAFQARFTDLDDYQQTLAVILALASVLTTGLSLTPVVLHRSLFRSGRKDRVVHLGDRLLTATIIAVGLVLSGAAMLVTDVVIGRAAGVVAGVVVLLALTVLWLVLPLRSAHGRHRLLPEDEDEPS